MREQEKRFVFLYCIATCCLVVQNYQMAYSYLDTLEDIHLLNVLIWYALLGWRNADVQRQVWVYPRRQQYFLEMFQSHNMDDFFKEHSTRTK